MSPRRAADQAGFALPVVILVVAMLAVVFLVAVEAMSTLSQQTRRAKARLRFEEAALSVEARSAYLAATEPMDEATVTIGGGLARLGRREVPPRLFLDGRAYAFGPSHERVLVSVQDAAGQLNLNLLPEGVRRRLMTALGANARDQVSLDDRWGDYIDPDRRRRLHGAEGPEYTAVGAAPPPDRPMGRVAELPGILGWRGSIGALAWRQARDLVTVDPVSGQFNVNTAKPETLTMLFGLDPRRSAAAVEARAAAPYLSMTDFTRQAGPVAFDAERSWTRPNGRLSLKVEQPPGPGGGGELVFRSRIVLTPDSLERPVWFEERAVSTNPGPPRTTASNPEKNAPALPDIPR